MKTEYFHLVPNNLGTLEAESFGSVFCRMASMHSVTIWVMLKHLSHWWRRREGYPLPKAPNSCFFFCPMGQSLRTYARAVSVGTGCDLVERTSLDRIAVAISERAIGMAKDYRRWCPACWQSDLDSGSTPYERLLWQLAPVGRCTLHRISLEHLCPLCHNSQVTYCKTGSLSTCASCFGSLISPAKGWQFEFKPSLGEVDCIDLVESASSGDLSVEKDAFLRFYEALGGIASKERVKRYQSPLLFGKAHARRLRHAPTFATAIKECALTGVSFTHVLADPEDAARWAGVLEVATMQFAISKARRMSPNEYALARSLLQREIDKPDDVAICTAASIEREAGVVWLSIRRKFPELSAEFTARRLTWEAHRKLVQRKRIEEVLASGLLKDYFAGKIASQDHVVVQLVRKTGANVRTARTELARMLALQSTQPIGRSRLVQRGIAEVTGTVDKAARRRPIRLEPAIWERPTS